MTVKVKDRSQSARQVVQDALLTRMQVPLASFDQLGRVRTGHLGRVQLRSASRDAMDLAGAPLHDVIDWYFRQTGPAVLRSQLGKMSRPDLIALAMTRSKLQRYFRNVPARPQPGVALATRTGDLPGIISDTLGKATSTLYAEARRSWRAWAKRVEVDNFQQQDRVRLKDFDNLPKKLAGDEIEFHVLRESGREQYVLATYARGVSVTRETLLNDDVNVLAAIPQHFVQAASRVEDSLAYGILETNANMADGSALFSTAHSNTISGALTSTAYGDARAKLARQTTPGGDVVDLVGSRLIVPPELSGTAEGVRADASRARRALDETPAELVESPFLSDTSKWYLSADPRRQPCVEVAFLRSEPEPVVQEQADSTNDVMKIKCRHNTAAAAIDYRAIVQSSGA